MRVTCDICQAVYDDFDHLTYCPHSWFPPNTTLANGIDDAPMPPDNWKPGPLTIQNFQGALIEAEPRNRIRFTVIGSARDTIIDQAAGIISGFLHEIPVDHNRIVLKVAEHLSTDTAAEPAKNIVLWKADVEYRW